MLPQPSNPVWEYQWADSLNAIGERQVVPELPTRLCMQVAQDAAPQSVSTILVRGELGIGKTTLTKVLSGGTLRRYAEEQHSNSAIANALLTTAILEAGDLETPVDLARRANSVPTRTPLILLARPTTLDSASQWLRRLTTAVVTMSPFAPTGTLFRPCLDAVCATIGLSGRSDIELVAELAGRLPAFMCTPFYFERLAELCARAEERANVRSMSPLEILDRSLTARIGATAYEQLVRRALSEGSADIGFTIPGLIDESGNFEHDGYRAVVLASLVLNGRLTIQRLLELPNPVAPMRMLLDHAERSPRSSSALTPLHNELESIVRVEEPTTAVPHFIYLQALIADSLQKMTRSDAANVVRTRCVALIEADTLQPRESLGGQGADVWGVSDALSVIGDPRLLRARAQAYGETSGYFTFVDRRSVEVGSAFIPRRTDDAKPVLPYSRQPVEVGPLWVANFLVTNELYQEFWSHPLRDRCFSGTGQQWVENEPGLMAAIEHDFDVSSRRCFWKEVRDQESADAAGIGSAMPILTIARVRALRQERVMLWDPTQSDDRFSRRGCPVVGITWWEAMAFCRWWELVKLPQAGLSGARHVSLLTDWEWEALRRIFYEGTAQTDAAEHQPDRYRAHLRLLDAGPGSNVGSSQSVRRSIHVGLFPVPCGSGPADMVGNVWEWTRSRVYGRIVPANASDGVYGATAWSDGNAACEHIARTDWRDVEIEDFDLTYRAVRGGSFFSVDRQAAWNPAYRLCDPPYSSHLDLGFRIAVYT